MLKIEKNYLSVAGIKFQLPQNFYIDMEGFDGNYPDELKLLSEENDCYISFTTTEIEYKSAVHSLLDIFLDDVDNKDIMKEMFRSNDTGYIWIEAPQTNEINNLKCACVEYETIYNYCYEIHFERINGFDRQLEILLVIPKEKSVDLETVLKRKNVKEFYSSILLA